MRHALADAAVARRNVTNFGTGALRRGIIEPARPPSAQKATREEVTMTVAVAPADTTTIQLDITGSTATSWCPVYRGIKTSAGLTSLESEALSQIINLCRIGQAACATAANLAKMLTRSRTSIYRTLKSLTEKGLVTRVKRARGVRARAWLPIGEALKFLEAVLKKANKSLRDALGALLPQVMSTDGKTTVPNEDKKTPANTDVIRLANHPATHDDNIPASNPLPTLSLVKDVVQPLADTPVARQDFPSQPENARQQPTPQTETPLTVAPVDTPTTSAKAGDEDLDRLVELSVKTVRPSDMDAVISAWDALPFGDEDGQVRPYEVVQAYETIERAQLISSGRVSFARRLDKWLSDRNLVVAQVQAARANGTIKKERILNASMENMKVRRRALQKISRGEGPGRNPEVAAWAKSTLAAHIEAWNIVSKLVAAAIARGHETECTGEDACADHAMMDAMFDKKRSPRCAAYACGAAAMEPEIRRIVDPSLADLGLKLPKREMPCTPVDERGRKRQPWAGVRSCATWLHENGWWIPGVDGFEHKGDNGKLV